MLCSMYGIFKDNPARRAVNMAIAGSTTFPQKFCQARQLDNVDVDVVRATEIFIHVKYV